MKKITFALIMSMLLQTMCFAYEPAITGYEYIKKIDEAYMDSNPRKMEKNWKKLCEVNMQFCNEKYNVYYNGLLEAKARRKEIRKRNAIIFLNAASGATSGYARAQVNSNNQALANFYALKNMEYRNREIQALEKMAKPQNYTIYQNFRPVATIEQRAW